MVSKCLPWPFSPNYSPKNQKSKIWVNDLSSGVNDWPETLKLVPFKPSQYCSQVSKLVSFHEALVQLVAKQRNILLPRSAYDAGRILTCYCTLQTVSMIAIYVVCPWRPRFLTHHWASVTHLEVSMTLLLTPLTEVPAHKWLIASSGIDCLSRGWSTAQCPTVVKGMSSCRPHCLFE